MWGRAGPEGSAAAVAAALTLLTAGCGATIRASPRTDGDRVAALLRGIEQRNVSLGDPAAPRVLTIFAEPDLLRYGGFAHRALPQLIRRHVREGRLRIVLAPADRAAPGGPDRAPRAAADMLAAGLQDRLWHFALLYERAGTGTYDRALGRRVASTVPGLDLERFRADARSRRVRAAVRKHARRLRARPGPLPQLRLDPPGPDGVRVLSLREVDPARVLGVVERGLGL